MKRTFVIFALVCLVMFIATPFIKDAKACYCYYDLSDAPGYGTACHGMRSSTTSWQWFGSGVDSEWTTGHDPEDDGFSFGNFELGKTANVQFTAYSWRRSWYCHPVYEQIRVWIDWNQDKDFNDLGENVFTYSWELPISYGIKTLPGSFDVLVPTDALLGTTWLRARICCQNDVGPTGYRCQGEVEDYQVDVVPEPATMVLLGSLATGLFGIAGIRKRFTKH